MEMNIRITSLVVLSTAVLLLLATACRPASETADVATDIPATAETAATLPPPPTLVATAAPTVAPTETATPATAVSPTATVLPATEPAATPTETAEPESAAPGEAVTYDVVYVTEGDTLNVRQQPGADADIVGELPPGATGIDVNATEQSLIAGSTWVEIETADTTGWVNSRYLTERVPAAEFCADPAVDELVSTLQQAVDEQDGRLLAALVDPERGLRLRHDWWNDEVLIDGEAVAQLFSDTTAQDWGTASGSGLPIQGSFTEVLLPLLQRDLPNVDQSACNEIVSGPTAGLVRLPDGYESLNFVSLYREAGDASGFDWGTWVVGIERRDGRYYLSYLTHYAYEI